MKTWEALVTMTAARWHLDKAQFIASFPQLEAGARKALREIGTTAEEIESEFPEEHLREGLDLIINDPVEFRRQAQKAMQQIIGNN